jgi:hypothetical protein
VLSVVLPLAALLAGGCASIPAGVSVQSTPTPSAPGASGEACCRVLVGGPQPGWLPAQVVQGFLLASTSFAHDHAIAREYLTPAASKQWQPGSSANILAQSPTVKSPLSHYPVEGPLTVTVTGQQVATLNDSGQYIPADEGADLNFLLQPQPGGKLLIADLPPTGTRELLFSEDFFHLEYAPRNLYYYGLRNELVPDPVFVPADSADPVGELLKDLRRTPAGWLRGAAGTAFPRGAQFVLPVHILPGPSGGKIAIVDVRVPRGTPSSQRQMLAEQIATTLTSHAYGSALFQTVQVRVNGHQVLPPGAAATEGTRGWWQPVRHATANAPVYFVAGGGGRVLTSLSTRPSRLAGQAGGGPFTRIAVAPDGVHFAGVDAGTGSIVTALLRTVARVGPSSPPGQLHDVLGGRSFTSLSWDSWDDLWVVGQAAHASKVWVYSAANGKVSRVGLPSGLGPVTSVRVAADGVRVAMILGTGSSAHLALAAVMGGGGQFSFTQPVPLGPDLTHVTSLTWYDGDHLLAVTQSPGGSRLWEVPVNGDQATPLGEQPGIESITAAGPGNPLYASISGGHLAKSVGLGEPWTGIAPGEAATYAG